jgi:large subunit ribosomal protein L31
MKQGIHPEYKLATVHCACGNTFQTRSTQDDIHLDVCSVCHPYFTGRQRLMDTAGRVERFRRKWGGGEGPEAAEVAEVEAEAEAVEADAPEAEATVEAPEAEAVEAVEADAPEAEAGVPEAEAEEMVEATADGADEEEEDRES